MRQLSLAEAEGGHVGLAEAHHLEGAQRAGLQGWLVRTGKFRLDVLQRADVTPDRVLDSVAELGQ